jgi:hypothetical protein
MTAEVVERINREHTPAERRAFCRVAKRVQALRSAGVLCPILPTDSEVLADSDGARLLSGAVLATTAEEWAHYWHISDRVRRMAGDIL